MSSYSALLDVSDIKGITHVPFMAPQHGPKAEGFSSSSSTTFVSVKDSSSAIAVQHARVMLCELLEELNEDKLLTEELLTLDELDCELDDTDEELTLLELLD